MSGTGAFASNSCAVTFNVTTPDADSFRRVVGATPADYLAAWRLSLTRQQLRQGKPLKQIADAVGYGSVATLSRAFKLRWGVSPREWKQAEESVRVAARPGE